MLLNFRPRSSCWVLLVLAFGLLAGCSASDKASVNPEAQKLLVIGIDSADWGNWRPMLDDGKLPHLKKLLGESTSGRMKTFYPLEKSPLLWASICTGVMPEVHGIKNFVRGKDQKPVNSSAWYAPALWDIIGATGKSTMISGMWTTYPARAINGVMVSDYLPYGGNRNKPLANLAYPDSLSAIVSALRVDPASLGADDLSRFVVGDFAELEAQFPEDIAKLRDIHAADMGYLAVAKMLAEDDPYDLFFFYLRGPDMISHHFFDYFKSEKMRRPPSEDGLAAFEGVVESYYEWADEVMGEVLSWFPAERQVVVVSDHGFYGPRKSGNKGTAEHTEWGVFMVRSPLYMAGSEFGHVDLLDVCPTMLALLGMPPAKDMPGTILIEGLTGAGKKRVHKMEGQRVDSYMPLRPATGPDGERDEAVDEEIRKQLRSLGYIN